ncbi:MAG: DivIVA domain-containing protein [Actinobacteria bacterium]|nr:DivIVA domain-containing protein [Actinomycetota bacterium]MCL6104534.1 DivIVA domain-containing protein [Actinomycetota bacterium]
MAEDRIVALSTKLTIDVEEIEQKEFPTVRRGFDPAQVRAFLSQVARQFAIVVKKEKETSEQLASLQRSFNAMPTDEDSLLEILGQEAAKILRSARDTAREITSKAERDAARLLQEAEEESEGIRMAAAAVLGDKNREVERSVAQAKREAEEEAGLLIQSAQKERDVILQTVQDETRQMVKEAQDERAKVLHDLTKRRRALSLQIEQLRAGRESLWEAVSEVRRLVERVSLELETAEERARVSALEAGQQVSPKLDSLLLSESQGGSLSDKGTEAETDRMVKTSVTAMDGMAENPGFQEMEVAETKISGVATDTMEVATRVESIFLRLKEAQPLKENLNDADTNSTDSADQAVDDPVQGIDVVGLDAADSDLDEANLDTDQDQADDLHQQELQTRNDLLTPVATTLLRKLKRLLQDDQNEMLDQLRINNGKWSTEILDTVKHQEERYYKTIAEFLARAAHSGKTFMLGDKGALDSEPVDFAIPEILHLARELTYELVTGVQRSLAEGISSFLDNNNAGIFDDDNAGDTVNSEAVNVVDHVNSIYRQWRAERLERVVMDYCITAFSSAQLGAANKKTVFRWIVDDDALLCPDCEDNYLAGPLSPHKQYPTGHIHPPAHTGCRCLLLQQQRT